MGGWCGKFSNYMGHWCPTKSNYMGGWYFAAWKEKKENYLRKKKKRNRNGHFCLYTSSKLGCFRRILVKTGTQINFPIVASVAVITSLGKHVFSEEFTQGNNAIG